MKHPIGAVFAIATFCPSSEAAMASDRKCFSAFGRRRPSASQALSMAPR